MQWFDYRGHSDAVFQFYVGPRGIGKSYSALDEIAKYGDLTDGKRKWLYVRMSEIELKSSCGDENTFKDYNIDNNKDIQIEYSDRLSTITEYIPYKSKDIEYTSRIIGYAKSLETFTNLRGVSFADVDYIMFDEFIPELTSRRKPIFKIAGKVFLSLYETVNRNRELKGNPPVKCVFFGNSNTVDSDILREFGLLNVLSNMLKGKVKKYSDKDRSIYMELCSAPEITAKKRDTVLYKLGNKKLNSMALDNAFPERELASIQNVAVNEYVPICQYGEFSIWRHKTKGDWHIRNSNSSAKKRFTEDQKLAFYKQYFESYICLTLENRITFDSAYTKTEINNILGKTIQKSQ